MGCGSSTQKVVEAEPKAVMDFEYRIARSYDYGGALCATTVPVPTYYRIYGPAATMGVTPGDRPWVVLVHGIGLSGCMYTLLAEDLAAAGHNVLVYDLIGRGKSIGKSKLKYSAQEHDDQLWSLIQALRVPTPVTLLGTSMGGAIVTYAASQHPERVHRAILVVPAGMSPLPPLDTATKLLISPGIGAALMGCFGKSIAEKHVTSGDCVKRDWHTPEKRPLAVCRFKKLYLAQNDIPGYLNALRKCIINFPIRDVKPYADIVGTHTYPVDIIQARHDLTLKPAPERWQASIPRSKVHWLEESGHCCTWEDPVTLLATVLSILSS
jgi:pimeloyl-ACP methyl ester carboxylesterase